VRANKTQYNMQIASFACPSDTYQSTHQLDVYPLFLPGKSQLVNYCGTMTGPMTLAPTGPWQDGVFKPKEYRYYTQFPTIIWGDAGMDKVKLKDFVDGTSKTFIVMEKQGVAVEKDGTLNSQTWFNIPIWYGLGSRFTGFTPIVWWMDATIMPEEWGVNPPFFPSQNLYTIVGTWNYSASFHPGGVNALLGDGSTECVSSSIERRLLRTFLSKAKGDNTGNPTY
jgi:prepilin-type processing-associated H-X9-DG protein